MAVGRADHLGVLQRHGGGFLGGSRNGIANYMKVLAGRRYTMAALEYSKGYGTKYPKPVEQVNQALAFLMANAADFRIDPGAVIRQVDFQVSQ